MNNHYIDLSIIVPAYNTEGYIERCIVSLCEQNYDSSKFEVIVVDDESPDHLRDVVKRLQPRYANLKYIWETNGRQGKARNTGVKHARGRYIAFVDSDDCWLSRDVISTVIPLCDENNLDILQSSSYTGIAADADLEMVEIPYSDLEIFERNSYLQHGVKHYAVIFSIYRTEIIGKIAFREGAFFEDLDYTYKSIWVVGGEGRIGRINYPYYGYRENPLSVTRAPSLIAYSENVSANCEVAQFLQNCEDMEAETEISCRRWLSNSVIGLIKHSKHFSIRDSIGILKRLKNKELYSYIIPCATLRDRFILFAFQYFTCSLLFAVCCKYYLKQTINFLR